LRDVSTLLAADTHLHRAVLADRMMKCATLFLRNFEDSNE
jgi:hypothetical protein